MRTVDPDIIMRRLESERIPQALPWFGVVGVSGSITIFMAAGNFALMQKLAAKHFQLRVTEARQRKWDALPQQVTHLHQFAQECFFHYRRNQSPPLFCGSGHICGGLLLTRITPHMPSCCDMNA